MLSDASGHAVRQARRAATTEWKFDARIGGLRRDALDYQAVCDTLRDADITFVDQVPSWHGVSWGPIHLPPLRAEQQQAVEAWMRSSGGVIVMPTGTGKTEVALAIMQRMSISTLVVAPVRDLMYQWHQRILRGLGWDAGIIGDGRHQPRDISVTTYDSAAIHMDKLGNRFGLLIFDECHHLPGRFYREAARMSAAPLRLGLTATLERADGAHVLLEELIGPVVHRLSLAETTSLTEYEIKRIPVRLSDDEQHRYDRLSRRIRAYMAERRKGQPSFSFEDLCADAGTDPGARAAQRAFWEKKSIEDRAEAKLAVLEDLFRLHAGERVIVFAGSNVMAREVSARFLIPTILSHSRKRERLEVLEGFREGRYRALVANQVLDEGVDVPAAKVAVVIGGLASTRQATQRLGRILRKSGPQRAVLYEVVCEETGEVERSRKRRRTDAYKRARPHSVRERSDHP